MSIHIGLGFVSRTLSSTLAAALVAATATGRPATPSLGDIPELAIVTHDFRFDAPDSVPAGLTRVRLRNEGKEHHHAQIVRLGPGVTIPKLLEALGKSVASLPAGTKLVGGPNVPAKGGMSEVVLTLEAGPYALICFVSGDDHVPHLAKGMTRLITVTKPQFVVAKSKPRQPVESLRMTLHDYAFELPPVIAAGRHTIRVENAASQPHEAVLGKLKPGKTVGDLMQWMKTRDGEMPGEEVGGTVGLSTGEVNFVNVDLTAGEYILLCFVPDAKDGKSHLSHGMIRQFTVSPNTAATSEMFDWSGVYDLVGDGFPDGQRRAVMEIARKDTSFALVSVQGPPGALVQFRVKADSAHIMWNLGTDLMVIDLRGTKDSLTGIWTMSEWSGFLRGTRRK
jgi:uncharacterized cupredoxin-like copper-binding protein